MAAIREGEAEMSVDVCDSSTKKTD